MKNYMIGSFILMFGLLYTYANPQTLLDNFSDNDFTNSPIWTGDAAYWSIVQSSDVSTGASNSYTLRLNASNAGNQYLSTQISSWGQVQEWGFFIGRRDQAYTAQTEVFVWLYANESNLESATVDGYAINIGDDSGGDDIKLVKMTNGVANSTISSTVIANGLTDIGMLVRVTRNANGVWELFTSTLPTVSGTGNIASDIPNSTNASISAGIGTDKTYAISANGYFGISCEQIAGSQSHDCVELDQIYFTPTALSAGDLIVTEMMMDPSAVSDANGEWFEILNTSSNDIDINGMIIKDAGSESHTIDNGQKLLLCPNEYLVLGKNASTATNGNVNIDYKYITIDLTNTADEIILETGDGLELDRVEYNSSSGWTIPTGASLIFNASSSADNNVSTNWTTATTREGNFIGTTGDKGSPGINNSPSSTTSASSSGNWSSSNSWSSGTPGLNTDVTITSGIISIDGDFECHHLTIQSGASIEISSTSSLTVHGTLTNSNSGTNGITIYSDVNGTGALIHNSPVNGVVKRFAPGPTSANATIHYVSSPVSGASGSNLVNSSLGNYNVYKYVPGGSPEWQRVFGGTSLESGFGYYVAYNDDNTITFEGTLNYQSLSSGTAVSISSSNADWNLLGNPFTSPISCGSFIDGNNNINGSIKFWVDDESNGSGYSSSDYASWSKSGVTISTSGGDQSATVSDYIEVGQGFFVESNGNGATVDFDGSWRYIYNPSFYTAEKPIFPRFWLSLNDAQNDYNEILLAFIEEATAGFDRLYDSHKLFGNQNIGFYSFLADNELEYCDIQALPLEFENLTIKLGFYTQVSGQNDIKLKKIENFDKQSEIILIDKYLDKVINLIKDTIYSFESIVGEHNDRFEIHFNKTSSIINHPETSSFKVKYTGDIISIKSSSLLKEIIVYNSLGQIVEVKELNGYSDYIGTKDFKPGCYFVNIMDQQSTQTHKVFVK